MSRVAVASAEGREASAEAVLAERAARFGPAPTDERADDGVPHLLFRARDTVHAVALSDVEAVATLPPLTPVPGAPRALAGVVAWRGGVVNLFDPPAAGAPGSGDTMVLLRHHRPRIALRADAATGIADLPPAADGAPASLLDTPDGRVLRHSVRTLADALVARSRHQEG